MGYLRIVWDDPSDPNGNVQHIAEHGLEIDDVEDVLANPKSRGTSSTTGRPCVWGYTLEQLYLIVVYEELDEISVRVVTAYEVPETRS